VFSFYPVKHMTTAEGGMVVSRHRDVVASIANLKAFGYDRTPAERTIPGVYDIARLGLNYRMNELAAAIGLVQLAKVPSMQQRRVANAVTLRRALASVPGITILADGDDRRVHAHYCTVVVLDLAIALHRPAIIEFMKTAGVGTSVYYPVPIPLSRYYQRKYGALASDFPNASRISQQGIALPVGPHLDEEDMIIVAATLARAIEEVTQ